MGAAAVALQVGHVPTPSESGTFPAVASTQKEATLANALAATGLSRAAVADAVGVTRQRVDAWACPDHEAEPNLGHVRRMPRSVRKAIGQALLDGAETVVVPLPAAMWERAALAMHGRIAAIGAQVIAAQASGDVKAAAALLREVHAAQDELARFAAGVRAVMGGAR